MISTTIFPGRYIQGKDARKGLSVELARYGTNGLVVCDAFVHAKMLTEFEPYMKDGVQVIIEKFGGECCDEEIERLLVVVKKAKCQFIIGLGGGKSLDTAKAVAFEARVPVIVVPTIAATDAPCSALSVIYTADGKFKRYLVLPRNPDLVLVDTQIIVDAPARLLHEEICHQHDWKGGFHVCLRIGPTVL